MRQKPVYVIDIIRNIVTATNTAVIAELQQYDANIEDINFVPGTEGEVTDVLTLMDGQPSKKLAKWPLFALIFSFPENKAPEVGIDGTMELNIIIARRGNNTDKTPARYENNFKPVLYPIYLEFMNQLYLSGKFSISTPDNIPHTKIDFPYYNADKDVNVFNSYVDAIQIKIKLKILLAAVNRC